MQKFILFFLFLLFTTGSVLAQQTYVWDQYGLAIDVPDDFKVTKNTDTEFELSGDQMAMYMYLFEQDISVDQMSTAVLEAAISMEMTEVDAATKISGDGLDGYFVEGYKDGLRVALAGMIDPKSQTNFLLLITFHDDDKVAEDDAVAIIHSVRSEK